MARSSFNECWAAAVSHDLRVPLTAIQIGVDFMRHIVGCEFGPKEKKILSDRLNSMESSVAQASNLVQSLIDINRTRFGELEIERKPYRPSMLVQDCMKVLAPLAEKKRLKIKLDLVCDEESEFDLSRMKQVVSNLVINAFQHVLPNGLVVIGTEDLGSEIKFYVKDDGGGVNPSEKEKIFNLFWQGEKHDSAGCGMGLAIAKNLVELHGGRIWVDSEPGMGSNFQFIIPKKGISIRKNA